MFSNHKLYREDIERICAVIDWTEFSGKTFLVTGATGLIGTVLVDALLYAGDIKVVALTRNIENAKQHFNVYLGNTHLRFIQGNVTDKIEVNESIDYIVNLASNTHPGLYSTQPINTIEAIVAGTKHVLDLAVEKQVTRVINASSVEIYGENRGDIERFTEDYCGYINCNTLRAGYPEGKRLAEALGRAYIAEKGIDVVSARLGRVYGAPTLGSDTKATTQFIGNAVRGEDIVLKSKGEQEFSCIYVADVVSALLTIAYRAKNGEAYNISDDEKKTFKELASILAGINNREVVFDIQENKGATTVQRALMDSGKLKRLGWDAKHNLYDGLTRTVEILRGKNAA